MQRRLFFMVFFILGYASQAQIRPINNPIYNNTLNDSLNEKPEQNIKIKGDVTHKDYKMFHIKNDTTYVDTTLTIKKDYKFNFIRKDDFELLAFHNQGQTYNSLAFNFNTTSLYPNIGAKAKHFNYYTNKDILYFEVPTPTTELAWRTGLEQGQFLDALISVNTNKQNNLTIAFKGLRSLGKYRNSLSSHTNMRANYAYYSKNKKYQVRTHILAQELKNNENGGLTEVSIVNFESNNSEFTDRGRLVTQFTDADNILRGNNYNLEQIYSLWRKKDSLKTNFYLTIGHQFNYETKHYQYNQDSNNDFFGNAFSTNIKDKNHLKQLTNKVFSTLKSDYILGTLTAFLENTDLNYRFKNQVIQEDGNIIKQSIKDNLFSFGANWKTKVKNFNLDTKIATTIVGNLNANYFKSTATFKKDSLFELKASILIQSKAPDFNYLLYQSDYTNYNWQNNFKNVNTRTLFFDLKSDKIVNASAQITQLDNHTYFANNENLQAVAFQYDNTINYIKVKVQKALKYRRFTLDNTIMFQNVSRGENVFHVPDLVTRNTLYYSNHVFKKKPLYIQTGVTFKYFTKYYANNYNPLLSEFTLQNTQEIGNYPIIDVFVNARIRQTRLFFKAEHLNSIFDKKDYYAAPTYPYRDFVIRFGLVWNFFI